MVKLQHVVQIEARGTDGEENYQPPSGFGKEVVLVQVAERSRHEVLLIRHVSLLVFYKGKYGVALLSDPVLVNGEDRNKEGDGWDSKFL